MVVMRVNSYGEQEQEQGISLLGSGWQLIPVRRRYQTNRESSVVAQHVADTATKLSETFRASERQKARSDQTVNKWKVDLQEAHRINSLSTARSLLITQVSVTLHCY